MDGWRDGLREGGRECAYVYVTYKQTKKLITVLLEGDNGHMHMAILPVLPHAQVSKTELISR